jgi:hypothetical protein
MSSMENENPKDTPQVGRNEPCPCGSGKKYKRCHGVEAAPKLGAPKMPTLPGVGGAPGAPGGLPFDPSQLDPAWMSQVTQALQRLPKQHMHKLQTIMQRAMSGQDVTREAAELERMLPPEFKQLMSSFSMPGMPGMGEGAAGGMAAGLAAAQGAAVPAEMTEEEARRLVAEAAAQGKIDTSKAEQLLGDKAQEEIQKAAETQQGSGLGKLWRKVTGKES